ncbi:hypothetical protein [Neisseria sicca]
MKLTAKQKMPAAFGRLCVETARESLPLTTLSQPPSGGCVLKPAD